MTATALGAVTDEVKHLPAPPVTPEEAPVYRSRHSLKAIWVVNGGWLFYTLRPPVWLAYPGEVLELNQGTPVHTRLRLREDWTIVEEFVGLVEEDEELE